MDTGKSNEIETKIADRRSRGNYQHLVVEKESERSYWVGKPLCQPRATVRAVLRVYDVRQSLHEIGTLLHR